MNEPSYSWRRILIAVVCVSFLSIGIFQTVYNGSSGAMGRSIFLRIGVATALLWLAWPTLRRPVRWLPPGLLMAAMIALGMAIANPKTLVFLVPAFGFLISAAAVLAWFRGKLK